jgi:O-antigen/teichoic acid export membrane protein
MDGADAAAGSSATNVQKSTASRATKDGLFNLIGWAWPVVMSVVTVPYFLRLLGEELYGIYAVIAIVAGYLSMVSTPAAAGNVRFLANALGKKEWGEVRSYHLNGLYANMAIAALSSIVLFVAAEWLTVVVFKVPDHLHSVAVFAFRIGAVGYFMNGIAGSLRSLPYAASRFDWVNGVALVAGTANTILVIIALWLGYGLSGAVIAQVLSSIVGVVGFQVACVRLLSNMPVEGGRTPAFDGKKIKSLMSFSGLMFIEHVLAQVGANIDRTLVGVRFGATTITYYAVPSRVSDLVQGIASALARRMYPIAAGSVGSKESQELAHTYITSLRIIAWISCALAVILITCSHDLLTVWLGAGIADKSAAILSLLAFADAGLAIGHVAHYTSLGLGRADINLTFRAVSLGVTIAAGLALMHFVGFEGVAWAMVIGFAPPQIIFSIYVAAKLLESSAQSAVLLTIVRIIVTVAAVAGGAWFMQISAANIPDLLAKMTAVFTMYFIVSLLFKSLQKSDVSALVNSLRNRVATQTVE